MKKLMVVLGMVMVGCGSEFQGADSSMGADAGQEASEVDVDAGTTSGSDTGIASSDVRADMQATADASAPIEASTDGGVPSCGEDEAYPQPSPTCMVWIQTTDYPLDKGCCRSDTHTCGFVMNSVVSKCLPLP